MSEFCPENVNRSNATGVSSENNLSGGVEQARTRGETDKPREERRSVKGESCDHSVSSPPGEYVTVADSQSDLQKSHPCESSASPAQNSSSPASVAPQEKWTVEPISGGWNIYTRPGVAIWTDNETLAYGLTYAHNSRLREKEKEIEGLSQQLWNREARWEETEKTRALAEKEIERLRGEIEEWRKRCERFRNL